MTAGLILIADDEADLRQVLDFHLHQAGYRTLHAGGGRVGPASGSRLGWSTASRAASRKAGSAMSASRSPSDVASVKRRFSCSAPS